MIYTIDLDACELHQGDENFFNDFIMNAKVLHFIYDRG